jgi:BMFP domain-containing protein YqiC
MGQTGPGRDLAQTTLIQYRYTMLNPKTLDDLARRLAAAMPSGVKNLQSDVERTMRAQLQAGLAKLDLVTREEFDVQAKVLARSRAKVDELEKRVAELEVLLLKPQETWDDPNRDGD